jgi:hypothetical protein
LAWESDDSAELRGDSHMIHNIFNLNVLGEFHMCLVQSITHAGIFCAKDRREQGHAHEIEGKLEI